MNVPEQIRTAARGLIEQYGETFDYLGSVEGQEAYLFKFPKDSCTGFPFLFLYDGSQATEVTGPSVFDFISLYVKDLDEPEVE